MGGNFRSIYRTRAEGTISVNCHGYTQRRVRHEEKVNAGTTADRFKVSDRQDRTERAHRIVDQVQNRMVQDIERGVGVERRNSNLARAAESEREREARLKREDESRAARRNRQTDRQRCVEI